MEALRGLANCTAYSNASSEQVDRSIGTTIRLIVGSARPELPLVGLHREHRTRRDANHLLRRAAHQHVIEPRAPMRPDHQQVGPDLLRHGLHALVGKCWFPIRLVIV